VYRSLQLVENTIVVTLLVVYNSVIVYICYTRLFISATQDLI